MFVILYYECHWYTLNLRNETLQDSNMEVASSTTSLTVSSTIIGSILTDLEARRKLGMYAL